MEDVSALADKKMQFGFCSCARWFEKLRSFERSFSLSEIPRVSTGAENVRHKFDSLKFFSP